VTVTAPTRHACGGRSARARLRIDRRTRHAEPEPETFELCLVALEEAIARAERWYARRERALADFDLRAAEMVRRLRDAGMLGSSARWEPA
jgi:hypothetical protein